LDKEDLIMEYEALLRMIKMECSQRKINAYKLAQMSNIPTSTIYGIFSGKNKAQVDTIFQILKALGLQIVIEQQTEEVKELKMDPDVVKVDRLSDEQKAVIEKLVGWLQKK